MKHTTALVIVGALVGWTSTALGNPEPPAAYDTRSVGMGSTGVAHVSNGAAMYHNPALLDGVQRGAVTGAFSPIAPQVQAPLEGPDTEVKSERTFGPLFLVGGAYRVQDRVTVGLGAYPTMGFGATYKDLAAMGGLELSARLSVIEIAPALSVRVTDWLALGLAYRVSRMGYGAHSPTLAPPPAPAGTFVDAEASLSGWNALGLHAGVLATVTPTTHVGLSYRSKITADMEGTTTLGGQDLDTTMEFSVPHIFKIGLAQGLADEKLLLALDLRYAMYADANESLVVKTDVPGAGTVNTETELNWKDSIGAHLGVEVRPAPTGVRLRTGYSVSRSATPEQTAMPVMPPPGLIHSVHLGAGLATKALDVDLGGYYVFGGANASPDAAVPGSLDGDYRFNAIVASVGATYRFGAGPASAQP